MGFIKDIQDLIRVLPRKRQTLFFSATINDKIKKLAYSLVKNPIRIQIAPDDPVARNITSYLDRAQVQRSGASGTANYTADGLLANVADSVTFKAEHKFTDNISLTGLYIYSRTNEPFPVYFTEHPELDPGWNVVMRRPKVLTSIGFLASGR